MTKEIYLAAGCFWGAEHYLKCVRGIVKTETGYVESVEKTYTIREVDDQKPGYTYDDTAYTLTLTLTDDQKGNITVTAAEDMQSFIFHNVYNAEGEFLLEAQKHLRGSKLKEGQFSFQLLDETGKVLETVQNDADGKVLFSTIKVDESLFAEGETSAVLRFTVKEEIPVIKAGITYDTRTYTATVTLTDNGDGTISPKIVWSVDGSAAQKAVFENGTVPPPSNPAAPKTGDGTRLLPWIAMLLLSGCVIVTDTLIRRRRRAGRGSQRKG